jgi:hypothetical protein
MEQNNSIKARRKGNKRKRVAAAQLHKDFASAGVDDRLRRMCSAAEIKCVHPRPHQIVWL